MYFALGQNIPAASRELVNWVAKGALLVWGTQAELKRTEGRYIGSGEHAVMLRRRTEAVAKGVGNRDQSECDSGMKPNRNPEV
jgi:hypothetical protein